MLVLAGVEMIFFQSGEYRAECKVDSRDVFVTSE